MEGYNEKGRNVLMALLNEFISKLKKDGLMRTARYTVVFPNGDEGRSLALYCDQVTLPGLNYNTNPSMTYGETREAPYGRAFENITLSFYVDNNMEVKKYFDTWLHSIQNPRDRTFSYYADYIKSVQINVEDTLDTEKYSVMLHECYPKTIGSIQLDYASKEVMKLSVTLAYKHWEPVELGNDLDYQFINDYPDSITPEIQSVFTGNTPPTYYA
jgi:hypothetical protein